MVEVALLRLGGLDVVSANAGIYPESDVADMALDELDRVLNVNLRGTILTVQACLPALRRSQAGRIVVTSSITGMETGIAGMAHYGASKAGQVGFVRSAALELAPDGITINAVLPGNIRTEGLEALGHDYLAAMEASVPVGRLGTPLDIARAVMFFAEESASFITGQTLILDGGQVLPESASSMR
jgi:3-oxoacyl-[acyl-carrier protein] reductase